MRIKSLSLSGFRNLAPQNITFDKKISFIYGRNGQGKTSILEAIYLLSQQKSFREAKISKIVSWGQKECLVSAVVENEGIEKEIKYEIKNGRRSIFINDEKITEAKVFFGEIPVVSFTPDNLNLVQGAPLERRKFLDRTLSLLDPLYFESLINYSRALRQRNSLLKDERKTKAEISVWDAQLAKTAAVIAKKRFLLLEEIKEKSASCYNQLIGDLKEVEEEKVYLSYRSDFFIENQTLNESQILDLFNKSIDRDIRYQKTNLGIQNDDFDLFLNSGFGNKLARNTASQGQARTYSLSLILASLELVEEKKRTKAIILLDDVESELDRSRKEALESIVLKKDNQIFITSTEQNPRLKIRPEKVAFLSLLGGKISPQNQS